jgi:hypothetical protein
MCTLFLGKYGSTVQVINPQINRKLRYLNLLAVMPPLNVIELFYFLSLKRNCSEIGHYMLMDLPF